MTNEQAIRDLVELWVRAAETGDLATLLDLLADDVVFTVPGRMPFGKDTFAESFIRSVHSDVRIHSELVELTVLDDWAWMRTRLQSTAIGANGERERKAGDVLRILRKTREGRWLVTRDTSLLMPWEADFSKPALFRRRAL